MARFKLSVAIILTAAVAAIAPVVALPSSNPGGGNTPATSTHPNMSGSIQVSHLEDSTHTSRHYHITLHSPPTTSTVNIHGHRHLDIPPDLVDYSPNSFNAHIHTKAGQPRHHTHVHLHSDPMPFVSINVPIDSRIYSHVHNEDGSIADHINHVGTPDGSHYHVHMYPVAHPQTGTQTS